MGDYPFGGVSSPRAVGIGQCKLSILLAVRNRQAPAGDTITRITKLRLT